MKKTSNGVLKTSSAKDREALLEVALDLTQSLPTAARYQRLLAAVRRVVPADAIALLRLEQGELVPLAVDGLAPSVLGRRYVPSEHPRLAAILASPLPVRFAPDDPLPDPYDGMVEGSMDGQVHVHSCMGSSLRVSGETVGMLTLDALEPGLFDALEDSTLATFAALAAAALQTAALIEALEARAERTGQLARQLVQDALAQGGGELRGTSEAMTRLRRELDTVAHSDLTVLVLGETGTGKELVARTLHARSLRAGQPLVAVNCAAMPEALAESELFGHTVGAFTGAVAARTGKFELAHGGTLFLDEVGELPLSVQSKLLRALQAGEVQRVGADRPRTVDVRIVAATNRDLEVEVKAGRFRPDLYHRLSVYPVRVPPLRERGEDIGALAEHFLEAAKARLGLRRIELSSEASRALARYGWPGNVRELEHCMLRAALKASAEAGGTGYRVAARHLALDMHAPAEPLATAAVGTDPARALPELGLREALDAFQRERIRAALDASGDNWAAAARLLQVDRGNLQRRAARLGLRPGSGEQAPAGSASARLAVPPRT